MEYKSLEHITLNDKLYSKEDILNFTVSNDSHFSEVIDFLKIWFSNSSEIKVQTSGSTGKPKQISIPKQSFVESALATCEYLKIDNTINALLCIPVKYIGGKMMTIRALVSGYNLWIIEPSANPLLDFDQKVNFMAITPYQAYYLAKDSPEKLKQIDSVIIGGGKVMEVVLDWIKDFDNTLYSTFGMTETVSHIALKKLNGKDKSDYFEVFPSYSVSSNEDDCLVIDCPTLSKEKVETNDIVEIKENKFKWLGRKDNIINSGGIKICPEEIEKILAPFLLVVNYYISSLPDEKLGNKLVLKIEKTKGMNIKLFPSFFNSKLEKHKSIKEIIYLDSFNYTENGKLIRD